MGWFSDLWDSEQTTTTNTSSTSKYTMDPAGMEEMRLRGYAMDASKQMAGSQGQYAELGGSLIDELFGGMDKFRAMMSNRDVTPEQRAQIEKAFTTALDVTGGRQEAFADQARQRMALTAQGLQQQSRDAVSASGMRGSAGSGRFAQQMAGLGQSVAGMEAQFGAERGALARESQGGIANAMLTMPERDKNMMLQMLQGAGQERYRQIGALNSSNQARQMLMGNPAMRMLYDERARTGTQNTSGTSTSTTRSSMGLGGIVGNFVGSLNPFGGGGGGDVPGASYGQLFGYDDNQDYSNVYGDWMGAP